jgi:hypothetical protein
MDEPIREPVTFLSSLWATCAPADHTAVSRAAALREAAELHRSGALSDDAFANLKRRLLGG